MMTTCSPFSPARTRLRQTVRRWALLTVASALSWPALAWGPDGHRLVAEQAEARLAPAVRVEVARLLALEPGATLASVASWADETREPGTAAWHYLNFARDAGCAYDADRQCVEGNCVVGALARQAAILGSTASDAERLKALKFVVHFVGDVHQPLHAGFADDRGGNGWQLQAFGRGSNLHGLWDSGLILNTAGGVPAVKAAMALAATAPRAVAAATELPAPARWAEESCRAVASADFYPAGHELPADYAPRWQPLLVQRLTLAGQRLAALLNHTLDPR